MYEWLDRFALIVSRYRYNWVYDVAFILTIILLSILFLFLTVGLIVVVNILLTLIGF